MKLRSSVVYLIECPGCSASYVGQTVRHLQTRFAEHRSAKQPVGAHFMTCVGVRPELEDVKVLDSTTRGTAFLMTLEALHIDHRAPALNTKDEFRSRTLTLKF